MKPHPAAVPDPDTVWGPPYVLDLDAVAEARAQQDRTVDELTGPRVDVDRVDDVEVAGVPCRVYVPDDPVGSVVYAHGGGWIVGSLDTLDGVCRRIAAHGGLAVVSVDYRMAPEHQWPAAVDDVDRVLAAVQSGEVDGLPADRVAIAGDSAGGHLATISARRARDDGRPVAFQALVYPVTDGIAVRQGAEDAGLDLGFSRGEMAFYWDAFVPASVSRRHGDVSPIFAELEGMPPTLLLLAEHDILAPEGTRYAQALLDAGVEVVVTTYPRMPHGFLRRLAIYPDAGVATDQVAMALRAALTA